MKLKFESFYRAIALCGVIFYIIFILARTGSKMEGMPFGKIFLVFGYVLSSTAPVFVSLETFVFAAHGILEISKPKTRFSKIRAVLDIIFGGIGLFVLCLYIGINCGVLAANEYSVYAERVVTGGTVCICLYWAGNIIKRMLE